MATTSKERQAMFKERMREAGQKQITFWADAHQAGMIRAMLEGQEPEASTTTKALVELAAREQALEQREKRVAEQEIYRKVIRSRLDLDHEEAQLKEQRRIHEHHLAQLEREQQALAKRSDKEKMTVGQRRAKLVETYTTKIDPKTGVRVVIDTSWYAANGKKDMADLSRKTRIAANTIKAVMSQFGKHELLSEREKASLEMASSVLGQMADAASDAKDFVSDHAQRIKAEEEARDRTSRTWAEKVFDLSGTEMLVVATELFRDSYHLRSLRDDVIKNGEHSRLSEIRRSRMTDIAEQIAKRMKAGAAPDIAAMEVRNKIDGAKSGALEKHGKLIQDINTALVAAQMEAANAKGKPK